MEKRKEHLSMFMEKLDFPHEAKQMFLRVGSIIENEAGYAHRIKSILKEFDTSPQDQKGETFLDRLDILAKEMDIHPYTVHLLFLMYSSMELINRYKKAGISLDIFWDSMLDLRCKLFECYNVHGIWGTFVGWWFPGFFSMERFALGRFQYEHSTFPFESYFKGGHTISKGDRVYNIHIPSSGPLSRESRMESYKKAYDFYGYELKGEPITVVCDSWLLYPDNEKFYPRGSNIISFLQDFDIIHVNHDHEFKDAWRVFGKDYQKPFHELPNRTGLQRAYIDWLKAGHRTGSGYGILLFYENRIL